MILNRERLIVIVVLASQIGATFGGFLISVILGIQINIEQIAPIIIHLGVLIYLLIELITADSNNPSEKPDRHGDVTDVNSNTDFSGTDLRGADLSGAQLASADFQNAILDDATLDEADLHGADLSSTSLIGASFVETNLAKANLHNAQLTSAVLRGSILTEATLTEVDAHAIDFRCRGKSRDQ